MNGREVLLEVEPVEALHEASGSEMVPPENPHVRHKHYEGGENNARDETQVGDAALATDEPLLLREDALQHAEHTDDLLLVPLNYARNLLGGEQDEPARLAVVRTE